MWDIATIPDCNLNGNPYYEIMYQFKIRFFECENQAVDFYNYIKNNKTIITAPAVYYIPGNANPFFIEADGFYENLYNSSFFNHNCPGEMM